MKTNYAIIKNMSPVFEVADLGRSLDFYTQKLGFEIDFRYEDFYAGIVRNGYSIHLKLSSRPLNERPDSEMDHLDLVFSVEKINDLFEACKSLSVKIVQPLRQMPYGREFYIADPDGYKLSFLQ